MNRGDLRRLSADRVRDAIVLVEARRFSGAYYLSGYAVECGLKACVARKTKRFEFPDRERTKDSYTHDLSKLVRLAGLEPARVDQAESDQLFGTYWAVVKDWSEESRYRKTNRAEAESMIRAVTDPAHGVIQWLMQHW